MYVEKWIANAFVIYRTIARFVSHIIQRRPMGNPNWTPGGRGTVQSVLVLNLTKISILNFLDVYNKIMNIEEVDNV